MWITDETLVLPVTNPKQTGISFARGAFLLVNLVHISRRSYHLRNFFIEKSHIYICVCRHPCVPQCARGGRRTSCGRLFLPSTLWVLDSSFLGALSLLSSSGVLSRKHSPGFLCISSFLTISQLDPKATFTAPLAHLNQDVNFHVG